MQIEPGTTPLDGLQATFGVQIENSVVTVECDVNRLEASPGGTGIPSIEIIPSQKPTEVDRRYRAALGMDSAEGREGITLGSADHGKADYPSGWRTSSFARPHKLKHVLPGTVRLSS